jgi:hypothetical protein
LLIGIKGVNMPRNKSNFDKKNGLPNSALRLKRRVVTVSDILARDDVNEILQYLDKNKANLTGLIVIATDRDGTNHYRNTEQSVASVVYTLEVAKLDYIDDACEE